MQPRSLSTVIRAYTVEARQGQLEHRTAAAQKLLLPASEADEQQSSVSTLPGLPSLTVK